MTNTPKFDARRFVLAGEEQRRNAIALLSNVPLGLEVLIREQVKQRGLDANALMWAGPLKDIAEQAYVGGRRYSAEVWHEQFKAEFLPEDDATDLCELVKDPIKWKKWDYTPNGDRVLIGSTTDLTKKGFSQYLEQIHAYGSLLGVQFGVRIAA